MTVQLAVVVVVFTRGEMSAPKRVALVPSPIPKEVLVPMAVVTLAQTPITMDPAGMRLLPMVVVAPEQALDWVLVVMKQVAPWSAVAPPTPTVLEKVPVLAVMGESALSSASRNLEVVPLKRRQGKDEVVPPKRSLLKLVPAAFRREITPFASFLIWLWVAHLMTLVLGREMVPAKVASWEAPRLRARTPPLAKARVSAALKYIPLSSLPVLENEYEGAAAVPSPALKVEPEVAEVHPVLAVPVAFAYMTRAVESK